MKKDKEIFILKISGRAIGVMSVIVVFNLISYILQIFAGPLRIIHILSGASESHPNKCISCSVSSFTIINNLFEKKKQK